MEDLRSDELPFLKLSDAREYAEAISWGLAAALVRRHPRWQIVENHFGYIYDTLRIHGEDGAHLFDLVRSGRIHLATRGLPNAVLGWNHVAADRAAAIRRLEAAAEADVPSTTPTATPRTLSYRFLAAVTAITAGHAQCLRPLHGTAEGDGSYSVREELFRTLPPEVTRSVVNANQSDHYLPDHPAAQWWFLVDRDHEPVCGVHVDDGIAHLVGGGSRDLMDAYRANDRRITAVALDVLPDALP